MGGNDGHPARVRHHLDNQGGYARHLWAETAVGGATWTDLNSSLAPDHRIGTPRQKRMNANSRAAMSVPPWPSSRCTRSAYLKQKKIIAAIAASEKARAHEYGLVEQACVGFLENPRLITTAIVPGPVVSGRVRG